MNRRDRKAMERVGIDPDEQEDEESDQESRRRRKQVDTGPGPNSALSYGRHSDALRRAWTDEAHSRQRW
jgi:hypothetical protein